MERIIDKRKQNLVILLSLFFVLCLGAGIYVLITNRNYDINRYQDIVSWCDTKEADNTLDIDCKALLLNIRSLEDSSSCFDVQVLTKDKQLKDISVCEGGDVLSYTNEILEYKKLMPIDMVFTYTKEGVLEDYSFSSVSLTKLDDIYVQGVVNEDIANLVTIDPSSTTIQNSVDFCPRPEILPSYITESNKIAYTEFYNKNKMTIEEYNDPALYSIDNSTIKVLFTCDSKRIAGHIETCASMDININNEILEALDSKPATPQWGKPMQEEDMTLLKQISFLYDSTGIISIANKEEYLLTRIQAMNAKTNSEDIFCGGYLLINRFSSDQIQVKEYLNYIENVLYMNLDQVSSFTCREIIKEKIPAASENGVYFASLIENSYYSNQQLISRCNNLAVLIK